MSSPAQRFSFLTTAYLTEPYIGATIESVLAQTSPHWELVVVDNGRSEEMAEIVGSYASDPRIHLVRQENRGYVGGLTAAAEVATGDYLCPLDSDDQVTPDFVEVVAGVLTARPQIAAVGCDAHLFLHESGLPYGRGYLHSIGVAAPPPQGRRVEFEDVLAGMVPYYTAAISRRAWDAVGGYAAGSDQVDESVDIWLRLVEYGEVVLLPDRLARYRVREDSLSRDPASVEQFERALIHTFELHAELTGRPENVAAMERTTSRLRYHQALRRARWALVDGNIEDARRFVRDGLAERRTARLLAVAVLIRVAPRLLRRIHPWKERITAGLLRLRPRRDAPVR